jgi:hypothetical protein
MQKPAGSTVVKFRLTAPRAQARIREIAKISDDVILTDHALERMEKRGIVDVEVFRILRTGFVDDPPEDVGDGEWKCKITHHIGERVAGVVTIILLNGKLVVATVEWEDVK